MTCLTVFMFVCAVCLSASAQKQDPIPITVINKATDKVGNVFADQLVLELSLRSGNFLCNEVSCSSVDSPPSVHDTPTYFYYPPTIPRACFINRFGLISGTYV